MLSNSAVTASYTGNGVTTTFALADNGAGILFYNTTHIKVYLNGVLQTSGYDVFGVGTSTGYVTFTSAPANGVAIALTRIVPYTQETDFFNFDGNPADVTEATFDTTVMQIQQIADETARVILAPVGTEISSNTISGTIDSTVRLIGLSTSGPSTVAVGDVGTGFDAVFSGLASGDIATYNGTNWTNSPTISTSQIANLAVTPSKISTKQIPNGSIGTVASATTIVLNSTTTNYFNITGTTTITGITLDEGVEVTAKFAGALTLTNGANLINISGANITTAAGDIAVFRGEASGVVRMIDYVRASGAPVVTPSSGALVYLGSATASASATLDFTNGIDSTYDTYVFSFEKILLSTNASCYLRTSSNSGSSYDSGATDYRDYSGSLNFSSIQITGGPAQIPIINGFLYMYAPSSTSVKKDFFSSLLTKYTAGTTQTVSSQDLGGTRETTSAINAIRFFLSSGVFTSGTIRLYGVAKS